MRKLKVLYMPHPVEGVNVDWGRDLIETIQPHHDLRIFDKEQPSPPQFEGIEAIVDLGGNIAGEHVTMAAEAGVQFLQVQTNGLDHVDVKGIRGAGLTLAHCPGGPSAVALAESAMMFILMLAHKYGEGRVNFDNGKCFFPTGMELVNRTLGIIGFGASGQELARRAKPFGLKIHGIDIRAIEPEILDEIQPDFMGGPEDMDAMIAKCDFLSVHLHLTEETHHTIDARRIGLLKTTAYVINVARGELIDEEALYDALSNNRIGGAGLDAFAQEPPDPSRPVYALPNVAVSPHTAGSTDGTSRKRSEFALANLNRFASGEPLQAFVE